MSVSLPHSFILYAPDVSLGDIPFYYTPFVNDSLFDVKLGSILPINCLISLDI